MKYAFMSFSTPQLSLGEMLEAARRYGYDGIEPRILSQHRHGIELDTSPSKRREIRQQAEESGIALCCVATSCRYADPATAQQSVDETRRCLDLAADVGSPRIRVFGGQLAQGLSREDAIALVADSLATVAEHAAQRGVTICMETHDAWCNPAHVAQVMARVDHPSIGVNWDIMHPVRMGFATIDESFETLRPWIRHLHVHDGTGEGIASAPIGEGMFDHRRIVELLLSIEYDGYLSGEWINWEDPYTSHLPREVATLRRYEQELR